MMQIRRIVVNYQKTLLAMIANSAYGSYTLRGTGSGNGNGKNCMKLNGVWSNSLFQCNVNSSA